MGGLVKPLVLDKRKEIHASTEFKAECEDRATAP